MDLNDPKKAVALFDKGCTAGEASGCVNLAVMYRDGLGVAADQTKAIELVERACKLGLADVCP